MISEALLPLASLPFHLPCSQFPSEESQGIPFGPFTDSQAGPVTPMSRRGGCCSPIPPSCSFLCSFSLLPVTRSRFCVQISTAGRAEEAAKEKKKPKHKNWKPVVTHQANEKFCCHDYCFQPLMKGWSLQDACQASTQTQGTSKPFHVTGLEAPTGWPDPEQAVTGLECISK